MKLFGWLVPSWFAPLAGALALLAIITVSGKVGWDLRDAKASKAVIAEQKATIKTERAAKAVTVKVAQRRVQALAKSDETFRGLEEVAENYAPPAPTVSCGLDAKGLEIWNAANRGEPVGDH